MRDGSQVLNERRIIMNDDGWVATDDLWIVIYSTADMDMASIYPKFENDIDVKHYFWG